MTKNKESQATTINRQTTLIHDADNSKCSEMIEDCFISKRTWNFLSCILELHVLDEKVSNALAAMYGKEQAETIIENDYDRVSKELEAVLYEFVNGSIKENICIINFTKI